jgi:hypothetical protein
MDLGLTNVADTYRYVLNQSGSNRITLGDGSSVNWNVGGVVALTGSQGISGAKTFYSSITQSNSNGQTSNPELLLQNGSYYNRFISRSSAGAYNSLVGADDHSFIYSNGGMDDASLVIGPWSSSAKGLRITSAGNVGIGTASPVSLLHVNGDIISSTIQLNSSKSTHSQGVHLEWNKNTGDGATYILNQSGAGQGGIIFGEVSHADAVKQNMKITADGQVAFNYVNTGTIATSTNLQMNRYPVIKGTVGSSVTGITATVSPAGSKCTLIVSGSGAGSLAFASPVRATGALSVANTRVSTISFVSDGSFMYEIGRATSVT